MMAADLVLIAHFLFVAFVVVGFALIWIGHLLKWRWVGNRIFRLTHLAAITFVALEGILGMTCPLTEWENALRGVATERSFIAQWVHAILFYEAPEWVFSAIYVFFAVITAMTIRLVPMQERQRRPS